MEDQQRRGLGQPRGLAGLGQYQPGLIGYSGYGSATTTAYATEGHRILKSKGNWYGNMDKLPDAGTFIDTEGVSWNLIDGEWKAESYSPVEVPVSKFLKGVKDPEPDGESFYEEMKSWTESWLKPVKL